jgi:hypothetical protein
MPTFRIYYIERELKDRDFPTNVNQAMHGQITQDYVGETEWEETYDAKNWEQAMDAFFQDHAPSNEIGIVEEDGMSRPFAVTEGWAYDRTYVWIEDGKLMLYQGLDETTPGTVACPLCDGTGEVGEDVAADFEERWGDDEDEGA